MNALVVPAYVKGEKREEYWEDIQNCLYYYFSDKAAPDDEYWIISPVKPVGVQITDDNADVIKWVVYIGPNDDEECEWDFDNHRIKQYF